MTGPSLEQVIKGLMELGTSRENAERLAMRSVGGRRTKVDPPKVKLVAANLTIERNGQVDVQRSAYHVSIGDPPFAVRNGDRLELTLLFPPRSKKNHTEHYAQQSLGYRKFRNAVVKHLKSLKADLGLPLPEQRYNCAARFYTDNDRSDTVGLMQGLADALENAGVIANDRLIVTWDGSDQTLDKANARVELTLTPR
jgi:Holliday junction resolvase RusA-like endonuclease